MEDAPTSPAVPSGVDEAHSGEWLRMVRCLHHGRQTGFRLLLLECNAPRVRGALIAALTDHGIKAATLVLTREAPADFAALEKVIGELGKDHAAIHLVGWEAWESAGRGTLSSWNLRRERFAKACPVPLMVWLTPPDLRRLALDAPDLWAWRTAVLDFTTRPELPALGHDRLNPFASPSPERTARLAQIEGHLGKPMAGDDDRILRGMLLHEAGEIAASLGEHGKSRAFLEEAVQALEQGGNTVAAAHAELVLARIQSRTGDPEGALARLRGIIRTFENLKDTWSGAVAHGEVADILMGRGQLEEALRILRVEALPVFERMGDERERAITRSKIAEILLHAGQPEEALRIQTTEVLPVFVRLGDARLQAVTHGKRADILMAQGQVDEALRIRTEEELPVFERLGDVREQTITRAKIGLAMAFRGHCGDAAEAARLLRWSLTEARRHGYPFADSIGADIRRLGFEEKPGDSAPAVKR